jgi:hypothetical protein
VSAAPDVDLREPCSHCGACCTGTYVLWFTTEGRRWSAEIDQPTLDEVFERGFGPDAPAIVHEWNVDGALCGAVEGAVTDARELAALLERDDPALDADGRVARLAAFAREAHAAGVPLYIRDD